MKYLLSVFILLNYIAINAQDLNESFTVRVTPDNVWGIKFYSTKQYEYYSNNLISGSYTIIERGIYKKSRNKLVLTSQEPKGNNENTIPKVLYYCRMNKRAFEKLENKPFAHEFRNCILWKRYRIMKVEP